MTNLSPLPISPNAGASTVRTFIERYDISMSSWHKLRRNNLAPRVTNFPGMALGLITRADEEAWLKRLAKLQESKEVKLSAERRKQIATTAGRLSVKKASHVSKQKKRKAETRKTRAAG